MNTRMSMRARTAALLCASALIVSGCGSSSDDDKGSSGDLSTADVFKTGLVGDQKDPGEPVKGGKLTVAEYGEAASLSPVQTYATGSTGMNVLAAVYDTLMRYDAATGEYEPQLAESLESDDDTTWTLKLRDGAKFTDGTPLDANAVMGSLKFYMASYGFMGSLVQENLKSMKAPDASTVVFTLNKPWANFPNMLASGPGLIMAPAAYADPKKFQPIGAGPFVLKSQSPGERTVVTANEDYVNGRPNLDSIEFVLVGPDPAKFESLEGGEVDMIYLRSEKVIRDARQAGWPGMVNAVNGVRTLNLNARKGSVTSDVRVRQAISLAMDAKVYLERTGAGADLADRGLMAKFSTWKTDVPETKTDPKAAKKLLDEAKADGYDGKIRFIGQADAASKSGAVAIKAMLEAVGFKVELNLVNSISEQTKAVYVDGDFDMAIGSVSVFDADPHSSLYNPLSSTSVSNPGRYANPEMDKLLAQLQSAKSPEDGADTMGAIEELWKKDVPYIDISGGAFFNVWAKNVHGVKPTSQTGALFDKAWVAKD